MAFHVACPLTCERICHCELGFRGPLRSEEGRRGFLEEVARVEAFLRDPWCVRPGRADEEEELQQDDGQEGVVRVLVPRIEVPPPPAAAGALSSGTDDGGCGVGVGGGGGVEEPASAREKRALLQKKAAAASLAAEDYVRKLEMGVAAEDAIGGVSTDLAKEDQISSAVKVMCRICFSGENDGSEKAKKMLSCRNCNKKYHRSCVKSWGEYRDLFHWSLWVCPSCRTCEVCRRVGDPNKFMFCKRCDAAYHCYCQQPPHKNVSHGPYLCPKHTRCHSCGSTVHGSGHSTRWFLGYNFCDACGRLFMKEKYCPVCLKVYRDSESTPMVCCDVCQRWVHCSCDGISDEKYMQFQSDKNLYYKCAACRGDCYQIRDVDDAVQELWRRRDKADCNLIAGLRAVAGFPSQEESLSPSSDEEGGPAILKNDYGRTLKFSVKGLSDKATKNSEDQGKKLTKNSSKKNEKMKGSQGQLSDKNEESSQIFERSDEARSLESSFIEGKANDTLSYRTTGPGIATHTTKLKFSIDHSRHLSCIQKGNSKDGNKSEAFKGTKLVIHLGGRNKNLTGSPRSDASSCHKEQEIVVSNGSEETSRQKTNGSEGQMLEIRGRDVQFDNEKGTELEDGHRYSMAKVGKDVIKENSSMHQKANNSGVPDEGPPPSTIKKSIIFRRRRDVEAQGNSGETTLRNDGIRQHTQPKDPVVGFHSQSRDAGDPLSISSSGSKDSRPLKLKFKNPYLDNRDLSASDGEEKSIVKGQRSKRKRPSTLTEKFGIRESESYDQVNQEDGVDEAIDANWILQKLGKNAIGKRVEVQTSGSTWHKGVVSNVEGSTLSVDLDDGRSRTLELGKQGVRFISRKQKRIKF